MRLPELVSLYGAELPERPKDPDSPKVRTLAGGLDREGSDDLRALKHPATATTTPLTDGRHAYSAYWSLAILEAIQDGSVDGEELTAEKLYALTPPPPEDF